MGRHTLPAAADDRQPARTHTHPAVDPAPLTPDTQQSRPRGRRSALGPAAARSTFVEHPKPVRTVRMQPRPAPVASSAGSAVLSRTATLRAERAVDPRHIRRSANAKRAAILLAPAIAVTSSLTLALPANADTLPADTRSGTTTAQDAQTFTVAHDVQVPVVSTDGMTTTTTIVSYPTLDLRFGVTTAQAQSALSAALSAGGDRATIVQTALQYMGDPYVEGGASHEGIDCSGLTMVAYQAVGIQLVHYVPTQDAVATTIPESEALPGDLVVYDDEDHVGLYLGQGLVLQAPHPGEVVDIVPMYSAAHHFARVLPAGS
jgi:cell wall-associated NlpC family hydrolase